MTQHLPRLIVTLAVVALGQVLVAHAGEAPAAERAVTVEKNIGAQVSPAERSPQVVLDAHPLEIGDGATALPAGAAIAAAPPAPTAAEPITLVISKISDDLLGLAWSGQEGPVDVVGSWDRAWRTAESFALGLTASTLEVPHYDVGMQVQYFAVTDGRTISPAEQNLGFNPRVAPVVPSFSTPEVWWGDPLQFQTTGIDPIREANRLEIPYQAIAPEATGFNHPPGAVKFIVPDDARGGFVFLHANNRISTNGVWLTLRPRFTDEMPPNTPITFSNITSVAWVSCGGGRLPVRR
ncbi:MAG: hypothetical protein GX464_08490 [Holophagae bacterium]|nr:hypothetical protein [Holophagae bacterium]